MPADHFLRAISLTKNLHGLLCCVEYFVDNSRPLGLEWPTNRSPDVIPLGAVDQQESSAALKIKITTDMTERHE